MSYASVPLAALALAALIGLTQAHAFPNEGPGRGGGGPQQPTAPEQRPQGPPSGYDFSGEHFNFSLRSRGGAPPEQRDPGARGSAPDNPPQGSSRGFFGRVWHGVRGLFDGGD